MQNFEIFPLLVFDESICFDAKCQDLIITASSKPLASNQLTETINLVHVNDGLFQSVLDNVIGLGIVVNNPKLAIEILISKAAPKREIFNGCLETCTSIQTLDIIAESTKKGGEFLYDFVEKCISKIASFDRRQQERMAKILFLMLLSLQRAKIDIYPLKVVLNPFCLQFSRIKEAVDLYSILQKSG